MVKRYIVFAVISTLLNLISQYFTLLIFNGPLSLYVAIFNGTLVGLISKYFLDKKFVFDFNPIDKKNEATTFFFYTLTGIITTLLFWAVEITFDIIFEAETAKYIGAIIGLSIGYTIKFQLDKKFVFK